MESICGKNAGERVILHSDFNSFYASVELARRPELQGKPVSVGGDVQERHGIILASNPIAKSFGVKTGEALWQAKQKCRELVVIPPDFDLYIEVSRKGREIYLQYTDMVEPFGLDEAWLDVTGSAGLFGSGMSIAKEINSRIKKELGITVSVGVSYNKIFAKLGSDYKKPDGITEINRQNYKSLIYPLPVSDLLGVGRATKVKLAHLGIKTIGELACFSREVLCARLGKWGEILYTFANGLDCSPVAKYHEQADVKSIGNSTTAPRDLCVEDDVKMIFIVLADCVSRRMRELGLQGSVISIVVRTSSFCSFTRQKKLDHCTMLANELYHCALTLFRENYTWQEPIRSLGISVSDLCIEPDFEQLSVFGDELARQRRGELEKAAYDIKKRYGTYALQPAVLLKDPLLSGFDPKKNHTIHPVGFF